MHSVAILKNQNAEGQHANISRHTAIASSFDGLFAGKIVFVFDVRFNAFKSYTGSNSSGNQFHMVQIKTSDGKTLLDGQVHNLVQAMSAFAPPAAGQTTLPASYQSALAPVLAANWQ